MSELEPNVIYQNRLGGGKFKKKGHKKKHKQNKKSNKKSKKKSKKKQTTLSLPSTGLSDLNLGSFNFSNSFHTSERTNERLFKRTKRTKRNKKKRSKRYKRR